MVGARSLAMALNRLIDAGIDARNPRTAGREIPSGQLSDRPGGCSSARRRSRSSSSRSGSSRRSRTGSGRFPSPGFVHLPVPQALHVALPPLARRGRRARADRRVGRDHEPPAVAGVGARRRRRVLGRRLRLLLRAVRRRRRSRGGAALDRHALRRARRVRRRAPRRTSRPSRCLVVAGLGLSVGVLYWLGVAASRRCSSTSTRSCDPTTSAGSTRRSSR